MNMQSILPVLPLKDMLVFPHALSPLLLGRPTSLKTIEIASHEYHDQMILTLQNDPDQEEVQNEDLYRTGVLVKVISRSKLPGGMQKVLVEGISVVDLVDFLDINPPHLFAEYRPRRIHFPHPDEEEVLKTGLLELFQDYRAIRPDLPVEVEQILDPKRDFEELLFAMASFVDGPLELKQAMLSAEGLAAQSEVLSELMLTTLDVIKLQNSIDAEVRHKIQKNQKDYMISEQIRNLNAEIEGEDQSLPPDLKKLSLQINEKSLPEEFKEKVDEEFERLQMMQPGSPEYTVIRNFLETILSLPFGEYTDENLSIKQVSKHLNKEHHGLDEVKERILEHVAVLSRAPREQAPVLCLIGPPGVGKTTLARSVAESLGRPYVRVALGGVRDEAEIRGHRRTYIGALPGRIIQSLKKAGAMNPLILLDEIDKMSNDFRGDPSSALLEVLDPEQNKEFADHYLELGVDLSKVLFFTTANVEGNIPSVLRDRMEVVRLSGYHHHEKSKIAHKHLLKRVCKKNGLEQGVEFDLSQESLDFLIQNYTREAGVRGLERVIDQLARKRTLQLLKDSDSKAKTKIKALADGMSPDPQYITKQLGPAPFSKPRLPREAAPGIICGLAWTSVGGDVLRIECTPLSGRGQLKMTGSLGDVMKESAQIAWTLVRERASSYGVNPEALRKTDIHIHFPEGSIPKDGPSAGIGLVCVILSAITKQIVPTTIAFTGEVSLSGEIHAIGGLPEKSLAALDAGIETIYIPDENMKEIPKLPAPVRKSLKIKAAVHIDDVLKRLFKKKKLAKDTSTK